MMSRLVDRLNRLRVSPSIGFKPVAAKEPPLLLIASAPLPIPIQGIADALLIDREEGFSEDAIPQAELLEELPWGWVWRGGDVEVIDYLREKGCDFLVLDSSAPVAVLKGELGKLLRLDPSLPDGMIRALNPLELP